MNETKTLSERAADLSVYTSTSAYRLRAALARCDDAARRAEALDYADIVVECDAMPGGDADAVIAALSEFQAAAERLREVIAQPLRRLDVAHGDEGGWLTLPQARLRFAMPDDLDQAWALTAARESAHAHGIPPRVTETDSDKRYPYLVWASVAAMLPD